MNPANFQQAMMAGQGMPQGVLQNQLRANLLTRFQQNQPTLGWQAMLQPAERVGWVMQLSTSLNLANPTLQQDHTIKQALTFENEKFNRSQDKNQYVNEMKTQLQRLHAARQSQAQNMVGQMANPQNNMGAMNMPPQMQQSMSNQGGNPMGQPFPPQLQRPMQPSPLPMNPQTTQAMSMGASNAMPNQNANPGMQTPQQPGQNMMQRNFSQPDQQRIMQITQMLIQRAPAEEKNKILQQFSQLPPQRQQQVREKFGDPLTANYRAAAIRIYMNNARSNQNGMGNQGPQGAQPGGGMGQPGQIQQRTQQPPNNATQQDQQNMDFSQLMGVMMNQQHDALRSQNSGQLVVPASNNNDMINQNLNGLPMGLNGQVNPQGLANGGMQNPMQPGQGNLGPQQQAHMRFVQNQTQLQAQAQLQARARAQAQQNAQNGGQPGQQGQMNGQMNGQMRLNNPPQQSPMPTLVQPGIAPGQQQLVGTPQPRPTPTPTPQMQQPNGQFNAQMLHAMQQNGPKMANGQTGVIRRQLPDNLPQGISPSLRMTLQTIDEDHYKVAIERIRQQQMVNNANVMNMANGQQPGPQPGQKPQMGQGNQQFMGQGNGQNPQMTPQALQELRMQQRMQQIKDNQVRNNNATQLGQQNMAQFAPEAVQEMDQRPFPPTLINANHMQLPGHLKLWRQLKEWVMQNPSLANGITVQKLTQFQMMMWQRERTAQQQTNTNAASMAAQQNNALGGTAGPAPTAPMVPPGGLNVGGPQQTPQQRMPMGMNGNMPPQMPVFNVLPQEIQQVRASGKIQGNMSDDQIRQKLVDMRRAQWMHRQRQAQAQAQMRNGNVPMQQFQGQASAQQMPGPVPQQNSIPQPPQQQRPQQALGNQTPQMNLQLPQNRVAQATQRPAQPPQPIKTPQQQPKTLKRPAPEEVIEIPDNPPPPQSVPMQPNKSQQPRNATQNNQASQQPGQQPAMQGNNAAANALSRNFGALLIELRNKVKQRPYVALAPEERQQMVDKAQELSQFTTRIEFAIKTFYAGSGNEDLTRAYLEKYWLLKQNIDTKTGALLPQPTVRLAELEQLFIPFKTLVFKIMQQKRQHLESQNQARQQDGSAPQAGGQNMAQQKPAPEPTQPQQLNAANLEQHLRQQAANQGHRRSSSKNQAPPAPTAGPGQNPFPFSADAGGGVPRYAEGALNLTADKLTMPRKKQKKDGQPPSAVSTPAQPPVPSKTSSPEVRKQPAPEHAPAPPPPRFLCRDSTCEFSQKGFDSAELLQQHMQKAHAPPSDPLGYALEHLAGGLGLSHDGSAKVAPPPPSKRGAVLVGGGRKMEQTSAIKSGTTPPAGATPMSRVPTLPTKESPALDRLKTGQHANKTSGPTSAVQDKTIKTGETPVKSAEEQAMEVDDLVDFDPWKNSTIQEQELRDLFGPFDTLNGDWGADYQLRSPLATPATTPDTNITDKTASTRDSDLLEGDALNMTLAMGPGEGLMQWKDGSDWEPGIMDAELMDDMARIGVDEGYILRLDESTDINDWEGMFGPGSKVGGNDVPGWEMNDIIY